jgi:hypothetical protein
MKDIVIPALGIIVPILAAFVVIYLIYLFLVALRKVIAGFLIMRAIKALSESKTPEPISSDWNWVDHAIEEYNQTLKDW